MSKQTAQQLLDDARKSATDAITVCAEEQARFWKFMEIEVHAANAEVNGRNNQIIWAKLEQLASRDAYPLWMDAVLMSLTALLPVSAIVGAIGSRIARSWRLVKLPDFKYAAKAGVKQPEQMYLKNARQLSAIMRSEPRAARFVSGPAPNLQAWIDAGVVLEPEMVAGLRNIIRLGATAATQPLFTAAVMKDPKPPPSVGGESLPAVAVFKALLQWVTVAQSIDKKILEMLAEQVKDSKDEKWLKTVPTYLQTEKESGSSSFADVPPEWFQRFVEACLWCTTFDFTPQFKAGKPARTITSRGDQYRIPGTNPTAVLLPFPPAVWDNLIARHYDPFIGKGSETYKQVSGTSYVAPEGAYVPPNLVAAQSLEEGGVFDPRTRLSMHWSGILAPAILSANQSVTTTLADYLRL